METVDWNKWAVFMSGFALLISIIMPVVTYLWLDPKLQELRHNPKLRVEQWNSVHGTSNSLGIRIENSGRTPAHSLRIVVHPLCDWAGTPYDIAFDPPCSYRVDKVGGGIGLDLERTLGHDQKLSLSMRIPLTDLCSGYAGQVIVYSNLGATMPEGSSSCMATSAIKNI